MLFPIINPTISHKTHSIVIVNPIDVTLKTSQLLAVPVLVEVLCHPDTERKFSGHHREGMMISSGKTMGKYGMGSDLMVADISDISAYTSL